MYLFEEEIGFLMKNLHLFLVAVGEKKKQVQRHVLAATVFCDQTFNTSNLSFPSLAPAKVTSQFPNFLFFLLAQNCFFFFFLSTSEITSFKQKKSTASMPFKLILSSFNLLSQFGSNSIFIIK